MPAGGRSERPGQHPSGGGGSHGSPRCKAGGDQSQAVGNAIYFTYALVLINFYHVPSNKVPVYGLAFAVGNLCGRCSCDFWLARVAPGRIRTRDPLLRRPVAP